MRITVIATGFAERKEAVGPGAGKVVDMPPRPGRTPAPGHWRRRVMPDVRADGEAAPDEDLDVPAFLRRQAD